MSELRINTLRLRNFKGIRDFTMDAGGRNTDIFADNARGKTTLKDAFLWLLFDKDSANRKDFEIKTLDAKGEAFHGLEHEVECALNHDGQNVTLRKVYTEKWTKTRGAAKATFTGHTTNHFIDGVPSNQKEYRAKVDEICDENVFRLLTDPGYFNQVMKWQDRRQLLLEVCGDITDSDVIASEASLAKLPEILGNRSLEDHRKVIAARRSEINKELEKLPVRIDEVTQSLPETSGTYEAVESDLLKIRTAIQEKHQEKARLDSGGEVAEKKRQLAEARAELQTIENEARAAADEENRTTLQMLTALNAEIEALTTGIQTRQGAIQHSGQTIGRLNKEMESLREDWRSIDAESFAIDMEEHDDTCAACGQLLPTEQIDAAREKALAAFNKSKAERLERIDGEGKQMKSRAGDISLDNERMRKEITDMEGELEKLEAEKDNAPMLNSPEIIMPAPYFEKKKQIEAIEVEIDQLGEGNTDALAAITAEIAVMQQQIKDGEAKLAAFKQVVQGKERIEELKDQEKVLGAEYEDLEKQLFLTEEFIRTKVGLLEKKINARFELARFKLFEVQINGALNEVCELTINGVPYSDLNNGARINAGLDVIKTLSSHYGFTAPVIIDNAEAVTRLIDMNAQIIRLVVSEADKELRVETKTNLKEAVNG